jgi:hypothetical protein
MRSSWREAPLRVMRFVLSAGQAGRGDWPSIDGRERLRMVSTNPEEYCPEYEERR